MLASLGWLAALLGRIDVSSSFGETLFKSRSQVLDRPQVTSNFLLPECEQ